MLNLDTRILLGALTGDVSPSEAALLGAEQWAISAIVLWEIEKLRQLGRIGLGPGDPDMRRALGRLEIVPLDLDVCRRLSDLDFRSDPADEIIAATSLATGYRLMTRDRRIRRSRRVPLAL